MDVHIQEEQRKVRAELVSAEQREAELKDELQPLIEEKVEAEFSGKGIGAAKTRKLESVRSTYTEQKQVVEAKRAHLRQLHFLSISAEVKAVREKQDELVSKAIEQSKKIPALLNALSEIRLNILALGDSEYILTRTANHQLELNDEREKIQSRMRFNLGGILPPSVADVELWQSYAERAYKSLADF